MIFEVKDYLTMQQAVESLCAFLIKEGAQENSVFDSKLVAYELLGNVLKHANGQAKLQGRIAGGFIELKIYTTSKFTLPENKPCPEAMAEHGRGLFLVNTVCEERFFEEADGVRALIRME